VTGEPVEVVVGGLLPNTQYYYRLQFRGGIFVAGGDVNGDGKSDLMHLPGGDSQSGRHGASGPRRRFPTRNPWRRPRRLPHEVPSGDAQADSTKSA